MERYLLACLSLLFLFSCNTAKKAFYHNDVQNWKQTALPDSSQLVHTIFMTGEAGQGRPGERNPVLLSMEKQLEAAGKNSTMVFLGGNVPAFNRSSEKSLIRAKALLSAQLDILKNHKGKTFFIPGETDWNNGKRDGREALRWQEEMVENHLGKQEIFMPGNACGSPEKSKISDDVRLLFVDSQWWLQDWDKVDEINRDCEMAGRLAFLQELEDNLKKYDKERVVLFMHHPLFSNGQHGGSFSWKHHLFPLTMWNKNAWLPLPGLGTAAVLARQTGVAQQDAANSMYLRLKEEILKIAEKNPRNQSLIIVGAHDNSLQYLTEPNGRLQFIVSGSAGRAGFARGGKEARFVYARRGFSKLYFYKNNEVWLEFLTPGEGGGAAEVVFRKKLFDGTLLPVKTPPVIEPETLPDSATVIASTAYAAKRLRKITFGDRYRKAWQTPVTAPVFNLGTEFSHLTPTQQGGGMSSNSLRLESKDGREYVLRSIDKDVGRGLPKDLRETVVQDFIQDFKSGLHPYSAFVLPAMANAAGIYHTNPRLYYLPRQRRLGVYNDNFAGALYLFEERPAKDWSGLASFGHSKDIISYLDLLGKIRKNSKHRIDQKWALRSRLFDQFIHDADRHDDQWRWAAFPQGDSLTMYRPIPRDRDQAFFDLRGIVPFVLSRRFLALQQRAFHGKIHDVPGQAYPGSVFDRGYINELNRSDWQAIALELKANLTDSVIENAFKIWPPEIYRLNAPQMIKTLKQRRDRIPVHAEKLYDFYAKYVDVAGTEKQDLFEIKRMEGGIVEVSVFSLDKSGKKGARFYHRIFYKRETREVRLYGLDGEDRFVLTGRAGKTIKVRIIGGDGEDQVEEHSVADGLFKKTAVYDMPDGMNISGKVMDMREDRLKVNAYDRHEFKYNRYFPLITFGRTVDDGLLLGGGVNLTYYRFRKSPYGIRHHIFARFSANTTALNLNYNGDFVQVIGELDFNPDLRFDRPVIFNFFGLGNSTRDTAQSNRFNWVRLEKLSFSPLLKKTWYNGRNFTRFGPFFERVEVEPRQGRITDADIFKPGELAEKNFAGLTVQHNYVSVDNNNVPRNGLKFSLGATYYRNLSAGNGYARFEGSLSSYVTVGSPVEFTFATRFGGAMLSNDDFLFYHSNQLGGNNYLRGFHNNRFAGKSLVFHNTDLRIKLFYWRNRIMPFEFGLMGGFDYGRVWIDGDESGSFHSGISPGFWFTPYKFAAVTTFYTFTSGSEMDTYTIRLGFFF